jgi:hypothetical protein
MQNKLRSPLRSGSIVSAALPKILLAASPLIDRADRLRALLADIFSSSAACPADIFKTSEIP